MGDGGWGEGGGGVPQYVGKIYFYISRMPYERESTLGPVKKTMENKTKTSLVLLSTAVAFPLFSLQHETSRATILQPTSGWMPRPSPIGALMIYLVAPRPLSFHPLPFLSLPNQTLPFLTTFFFLFSVREGPFTAVLRVCNQKPTIKPRLPVRVKVHVIITSNTYFGPPPPPACSPSPYPNPSIISPTEVQLPLLSSSPFCPPSHFHPNQIPKSALSLHNPTRPDPTQLKRTELNRTKPNRKKPS